jgi:hypothetical protein
MSVRQLKKVPGRSGVRHRLVMRLSAGEGGAVAERPRPEAAGRARAPRSIGPAV